MSFAFKSNADEVKKKIAAAKEKALESVGIFIDSETKSRSPVLTGYLKGSYTHEVDLKNDKVTNGSPAEYAPYVELGTSKSGKQPHLRPAYEDNLKKIENIVKENLKI